MTTSDNNPVWAAVLAAEDAFGEAAEDHARREAAKANAAGDADEAAMWAAAAHMLSNLHTINRTCARARASLLPRIDSRAAGQADMSG